MPESIETKKRQFWQIAVRHFDFLREQGMSPGARACADRYAKLTGKAGSLRQEFRDRWEGISYEDFQGVEERRRSYHKEERLVLGRRLLEFALSLPQGDPAARLALSEVEAPIARKMLCFGVHSISEWEYRRPGEVANESSVVFDVYALGSGEIEELGRRALQAARHQVALEVLDEVRHYLNGHDVYDADQRTPLPSPSDIAGAVQTEHGDKSRAERVGIAMEEYKLDETYDGKTDERSIRKALNAAFRRREK